MNYEMCFSLRNISFSFHCFFKGHLSSLSKNCLYKMFMCFISAPNPLNPYLWIHMYWVSYFDDRPCNWKLFSYKYLLDWLFMLSDLNQRLNFVMNWVVLVSWMFLRNVAGLPLIEKSAFSLMHKKIFPLMQSLQN